MKSYVLILSMLITLTFSASSQANWFEDIIILINAQSAITNGYLSSINMTEQSILDKQRDIDKTMRQVDGRLTGHSGWGNYQFHDHQSYGQSAQEWTGAMKMAGTGMGDGALGQMIGGLSRQFPISTDTFNKGAVDSISQKYYDVKAKTVLFSRAASQLDYNKIQEQITYQQMLQKQIEKTKDLKAAVDLSSRIHVEGNLISLEILRQTALLNQQQAVNEQVSVNSALANAKFLTKE